MSDNVIDLTKKYRFPKKPEERRTSCYEMTIREMLELFNGRIINVKDEGVKPIPFMKKK